MRHLVQGMASKHLEKEKKYTLTKDIYRVAQKSLPVMKKYTLFIKLFTDLQF